jgi:superfamily II DNA/RNA helicase
MKHILRCSSFKFWKWNDIIFILSCVYRKEALRRGVYGMGFNSPSKIQETALPMLLADP